MFEPTAAYKFVPSKRLQLFLISHQKPLVMIYKLFPFRNLNFGKYSTATHHFSLLFIFLFIGILGKQTCFAQNLPHYGVGCGELRVIFVPVTQTVGTNPCDITDCQHTKFRVFLGATPAHPHTGAWLLDYTSLSLAIRMNPDNGQVSQINKGQTEACIANFFDETSSLKPLVEPDNKGVTMLLSNPIGENEPLPVIKFIGNQSEEPLFTITIDAFPNESFSLECISLAYESNDPICDLPLSSGNTFTNFSAPSPNNPLLSLSMDMLNCSQTNTPDIDYFDIPIYLNKTSFVGTINYLDFALEVSTDAIDLAQTPEIVNVNTQIGQSRTFSTPPIPLISVVGYRIHVQYSTIASSSLSAQTLLFYLRVHRPTDLCQGYKLNANLLNGRVVSYGHNPGILGCAGINVLTPHLECSNSDTPVCPNFTFNVVAPTPSCQTLTTYAELQWDPSLGSSISLDVLKIRVDFDMDPGITISNVYTEGFGSCPTNNSPLSCGSNCLSYGSKSVIFCVESISPITLTRPNGGWPRIIVEFNVPSGCVQAAHPRLVHLKLHDSNKVCKPDVNPANGFPSCPPMISGKIARDGDGCYLDKVTVQFSADGGSSDPLCNFTEKFNEDHTACGPYAKCVCGSYGKYTVTPSKTDFLLNGVSTYDLVLISKHILGIEALDSPYKMIAADANKTGSITTFDIVEFRKLILGIYDFPAGPNQVEWPSGTNGNAPSWRFVDKKFIFPNPANPFQTDFPESITGENAATDVDFVAIKSGDVNHTAIMCETCGAFMKPAGTFEFAIPTRSLKPGDYVTIPVIASGTQAVTAWQLGLRFDPNSLELIGPSLGDLSDITEGNFGLSQAGNGIIRALWFALPGTEEEQYLKPGQTIFNLSFKVKNTLTERSELIRLEDSNFESRAWLADGSEYIAAINRKADVRNDAETTRVSSTNGQVTVMPNPTTGTIHFDLKQLNSLQNAHLYVYNAFGVRKYATDFNEFPVESGVTLTEPGTWPAGVYRWEIQYEGGRLNGAFIKQ
jgi:hypothetical protein